LHLNLGQSTTGNLHMIKLDGTQNALILADGTAQALTLKVATTNVAWTLTLPTTAGTAGQVLSTNGNGVTSWVTGGGGGGSPSGPANSVQFNNAGAFGGVAGFTFDGTGAINLGVATTTNGKINLYNSVTPNAVSIQAPTDSTAWTLTLPSGPGTNGQVLATNGSGVTSWVPAGAAIPVTDDNTTAADEFPLFTDTAGGAGVDLTQAYTASTEYTFNPGTGQLSAFNTASTHGMDLNTNTVPVSYTLPTNYNSVSGGPISTPAGVTVTVNSGSRWTVV
jgi:hypothetical protein